MKTDKKIRSSLLEEILILVGLSKIRKTKLNKAYQLGKTRQKKLGKEYPEEKQLEKKLFHYKIITLKQKFEKRVS